MEYTSIEKQVLSELKRTDFKNLSKSDVISFATKLDQMRPEVAMKALEQFPELTNLLKSTLTEYKGILDRIIDGDDKSLEEFYSVAHKDLEHDAAARTQYIEFANKIREDISKCLDSEDLTPEERQSMLDREIDILRMIDEKDDVIRKDEAEIATKAYEAQREKRAFGWKVLGAAGAVVVAVVGIGAAALGGNFDLKLPDKE